MGSSQRTRKRGQTIALAADELWAAIQSGDSTKTLAARLGVVPDAIGNKLRRNGYSVPYIRTNVPTADILRWYATGLSCHQISARCGLSHRTVLNRLHENGVRIKDSGDYTWPSGPSHHGWKGGRCVDKRQGYVTVTIGPRQRRLEHRHVMEQALGRRLRTNEYVHHMNGIRDDNRPDNLVVTSPSKHESRTLIKALQRRILSLEAMLHNPAPTH